MDVNLIPSKRLVPGGDAALSTICLPSPSLRRAAYLDRGDLATWTAGTHWPGPHGCPEMKCRPRDSWGGCWVPARRGLGMRPGAKWGDKSFRGTMDRRGAAAACQLLAPFKVQVPPDPHRAALQGVTATKEGDSWHHFGRRGGLRNP